MGTTKKLVFQDNIYTTAEIFKALGHPARLQILKILLHRKICTCGTIVDELPLAQSTVSKHLLELKKANIVSLKTQGKKTIYSLLEDNLMFTRDFLLDYIGRTENAAKETVQKPSRRVNKKLQKENYVFKQKPKKDQ
jgi:ArsR family transcriptional regulator